MSSKEDMKFSDSSGAGLAANNAVMDDFNPCGVFKIVCRASDGSIRWEEESPNLVVNEGKNDLLNKYFRANTTTALFIGLKGTGTILATNTMATGSRAWSEITGYSNAVRPTYTVVAPTAQQVTNAASPAVFNINATNTVVGCFLSTDSTKNGTGGVLFSAVDFTASRNVLSGDTLTVAYVVSC